MSRLLEIPAVRNALGLHSPSRAVLGQCTCRRCRRGLWPPSRPLPPVDGPLVYHEPGSCEECDRRRDEWAAEGGTVTG